MIDRFLCTLALAALACGAFPATAANTTDDIVLVPQRVSAHGWFVEGEAGMAIGR